jgi:NADPH:quinone reductase-like Zn-dependent oxidoreductase
VKIRGTDFAGRVEAVGSDVQLFRPGDEVFGEADGAFAEYVCAPDGVVEAKPANLTFEQAAAVPLAGNTALIGLRDVARIQPAQQVLVNGASGGVGTFAVQIAKSFGAEVTGVCSTRNVDLLRSIGADHVIDYTVEDFARNGQRYDVVLDLVGNRSLTDSRRALTPAGTLVLSGGRVPRRQHARADGSHARGPADVTLRTSSRAHAPGEAEQGEPGGAERTRRVRKGRPGHRADVPAERGTGGDPVTRSGARARRSSSPCDEMSSCDWRMAVWRRP